MTRSFLELLSDLRVAETHDEIESLTNSLSEILEEDDKHANFFLYSMFKEIAESASSKSFSSAANSEFYTVKINSYIDDEDEMFRTKIFVNMAFLQDNGNHEDNLDEKILDTIIEYLKKNNLNILVNDISVNTVQFRNGKKFELDSYRGKHVFQEEETSGGEI